MDKHIDAFLKIVPYVAKGQRLLFGIDGLSRSGKTTFTNEIRNYLEGENVPVLIFHIDDFIVERKKRYNTNYEEWYEYYHLQWDVEWFKNNFFRKLRRTNQLDLPFYDDHSDTHTYKTLTLPETCLIIVEGVFLQRKEWRSFFDHLIYIECPRMKRFSREEYNTKENIEKFQNRYWKAEEYYLKTTDPVKHADLVITT